MNVGMSMWPNDQSEHPGDLLSALLDGELEASERDLVKEHLSVCSPCASELDEIRASRRAVRLLPGIEPPALFIHHLIDFARVSDETTDEANEIAVVNLDSARRRLRNGRLPVVNAAAAVAIVVLVALIATRPNSNTPTQVPIASQQHASAVAALVSSGAMRKDTAPFAMPNESPAVVMPTPTTSPTIDVENLPEPFNASETLAGGYELVEVFDLSEGIHLMYQKDGFVLSIFEEIGRLDQSLLPDGPTKIKLGDDYAWLWGGPVIQGRVVVTEHHGVVVTAVGDEPGEAVLEAVRSLPNPQSPSNLRRLRSLADRVLESLHLAG